MSEITATEAAQLRDERRGGVLLSAELTRVYSEIRRAAKGGSDGVGLHVVAPLRGAIVKQLMSLGFRVTWPLIPDTSIGVQW
jgi:hypothetical protein